MFSAFSGLGGARVARPGASTSLPRHGARRLGRVLAALAVASLLTVAPRPAEAVDHVVSRGQTLVAIARRYRTTVDALLDVNGLRKGQHIHPGLVLVIPEKGKEAEATKRAAALREAGKDAGKKGPRDAARGTPKGDKDKGGKDKGKKGAAEPRGKDGQFAAKPKRAGFVRMMRGEERLEVQLLSRQGRLVPKALPQLSRFLRASPSAQIPIDPRLATLIGMVSDHFGGRTIRVISGYRPYSPAQYTAHSNHNFGRALDFAVEGVPNTVVRDFCRNFRNAGVGYYPNSTFVHLDVRSAKTYWVDYSRPGEAPRYDGARGPVKPDEATRDVPGAVDEAGDGVANTPDGESQPPDDTGGI